ncbi:MAG: RT0821/Lpp0805 family surface protein [Gammaproteobacteria bacterium]
MKPAIEDSLLNAYVDDELALEERQLVETAKSRNPVVARRIEKLRAADALMRDALRPALEAPAPILQAPVASPERAKPSTGVWANWLQSLTDLRVLRPAAAGFAAGALGALLVATNMLKPGATGEDLAATESETLRARSLERALEKELSGQTVRWRNPDLAEQGEVVPVRTYKTNTGQYCREFDELITRGGETVEEHGVACREATGEWRVRIRYYP